MLDLRTNHSLTALKPWLTDILICSINWEEALSIHGKLRYTGHFSRPNLVLAENCIHLFLIILEILSAGYLFFFLRV